MSRGIEQFNALTPNRSRCKINLFFSSLQEKKEKRSVFLQLQTKKRDESPDSPLILICRICKITSYHPYLGHRPLAWQALSLACRR